MDVGMNKKRYVRLSIISIDVFTEMYNDIANASRVPPNIAYNIIKNTHTRLSKPEEENIKNLLTKDGYGKCEQGLLYKILRNILIPAKQGWGNPPSEHDISTSDDVERIRKTRNTVFHRVRAEITEDEEKKILHEILNVAKRLDKSFNRTPQNSYESKIKNIQTQCIDSEMEDKHIALSLQNDELKLKMKSMIRHEGGQISIRLHSGKTTDMFLEEVIPQETNPPNYLQRMLRYPKRKWEDWRGTAQHAQEPREVNINARINGFEDSEAEEIVTYLKKRRIEINDGSKNVVLKRAELGSINLFIKHVSVETKELMFSSIMSFLERLFINSEFKLKSSLNTVRIIEVLLFPGFDEGFDCSIDEYPTYSGGNDINLELTVPALSNEDVYETTLNFVGDVMKKTSHIHNLFTVDKDPVANPPLISKNKKGIDVILEMPKTTAEKELLKKLKGMEEKKKQQEIEEKRKQQEMEEKKKQQEIEEKRKQQLEELEKRKEKEKEERRKKREIEKRKHKEIKESKKLRETENQKRQRDKDLHEDVECWKKIRHETLPRLTDLKQELYRANEKIRVARTARNITTGTSWFFGAMLAPFTGGASLFGAAAMTTGVAGLTFVVETIIEKNVIQTTQAGVNKDKEQTIRLRQRVTAFQGTESSPFAKELFTVDLNTIINLGEKSLWSFISSWAGTESTSLLNAITTLDTYINNLERELSTVEEVQGKYAMP